MENLSGAIDDRDRWIERVREIHASSRHEDDDDFFELSEKFADKAKVQNLFCSKDNISQGVDINEV